MDVPVPQVDDNHEVEGPTFADEGEDNVPLPET